MKLVVAANNREDIAWTEDYVCYVSVAYHPQGREAYSYLSWIISNGAKDDIVFCQGQPLTHDPLFFEHLEDDSIRYYGNLYSCDARGGEHYDADLNAWCSVFGLPIQTSYKFVAGAQYRVTPQQLDSRSSWFYMALLNLTYVEPKAPWILERLWPLIWNIEL